MRFGIYCEMQTPPGKPHYDLTWEVMRQIEHADEMGFDDALLADGRNLIGTVDLRQWKRHVNALRALNDVGVGHDVAVGIEDEAGPYCSLASDDHPGISPIRIGLRPVTVDQYLDHTRVHATDQLPDSIIELHERTARFLAE